MGKKIIKVGGKTFMVDSKTKKMTEIDEGEEESTEETTEETTEEKEEEEKEDVEEKIEEAAEETAKSIISSLGIDKLSDKMDKILDAQAKTEPEKANKVKELLKSDVVQGKKISEMSTKEKMLGYFQALLRKDKEGMNQYLTNADKKALSEGVAADGGNLFPNEFRFEIVKGLAEGAFMRNHVRVVTMKNDVLNAPSVVDRPKVTWTQENEEKSTTTAHFGQITITARKMAAIMYVSDELIDDSEIDVIDLILDLFTEAVGLEENKVIMTGNGTTQPTGLTTARAAAAIASRTAAAGLTLVEMINTIYDLPTKYRSGAKWFVNNELIRDMRNLRDGNNRHYWADPVTAALPPTFYGYPVIEENDLPANLLFFGDLKLGYWLGDRQRMTVKITQDSETAFTKDQTAIRIVQRIGGNVVLGEAIRALIGL